MKLVEEFHDAKEYGSIIDVEEHDWELLKRFAVPRASVDGQMSLDIHGEQAASARLQQLIKIGKNLAQKYEVVITNPPYMSISGAGEKINEYVKSNYPDEKVDMYAVFISKCNKLNVKYGYKAMITQHGWMFLGSFEKMRINELNRDVISMAHLGPRAFDEIGGEVVQTVAFVMSNRKINDYRAIYSRLIEMSLRTTF